MTARPLGRSGIAIEPLVLGGNTFGWTVDQRQTEAILDAFVDAGFNAVDTADAYSSWVPGHRGGESETAIGHWLKARGGRDRLIIASKVGERMPDFGDGLSPNHIVRSVEASLRRLQTDYIDLYQAHLDDRTVPHEVTLEAFARLRQAGKVRAIGASRFETVRFAEALATSERLGLPRYETMQPRYNLFDRDGYDGPLQDLCVAKQVGVLCYSTLAKGFLAGKRRRTIGGTWDAMVEQRYCNERGFRILDAVEAVAAEQEATPAEIALAWVACQPGAAAPIIGVESVAQLLDLTDYGRVALDPDQVARLSAASDPSAMPSI